MSDTEIETIYQQAMRTPPGSHARAKAFRVLSPLIDIHPDRIVIFGMCHSLIPEGE